MKKWRVGSISMGAALVLLGMVIMLSQFLEWDATTVLLAWFPLILVVLGVEIILYVYLSQQEQPVVKYDFLSIIFITCLGGIALILFIGASTGVLDKIKTTVQAEDVEATLPPIEKQIDEKVKKIVLESAEGTSLETNNTGDVHIFGTFHSNTMNQKDIKPEEIASFHQIGDTLYIEMLEAPTSRFGYDVSRFTATVSIPGNMETEVRSWLDEAHLNLATIKSDWSLKEVDQVYLTNTDSADVQLQADNIWQEKDSDQTDTFGKGTHQLDIEAANQLHTK
ncbi:hypothetical protein ERJ70_17720 [Sediminibacillus dalangtanensis]|uniref:DUF5668 domain-containing protein n=1 Tax=Sediminibacillus dalangtanensis TaxID=2729421 RepID=A0ABX7W1G4_9BACI|nr:hypothetical protein [Sediminibacillus dalangtanensis]QTN00963.1 hypothetical protein ERJ70_17720 [Sediminibacillus dalangtanensis]